MKFLVNPYNISCHAKLDLMLVVVELSCAELVYMLVVVELGCCWVGKIDFLIVGISLLDLESWVGELICWQLEEFNLLEMEMVGRWLELFFVLFDKFENLQKIVKIFCIFSWYKQMTHIFVYHFAWSFLDTFQSFIEIFFYFKIFKNFKVSYSINLKNFNI